MTPLLVSLNVALVLQEDRIRQQLLTQRDDLPATLPAAAKVYPTIDGPVLYGIKRARLSAGEIEDIRILRGRGVSIKVLALHFGISQGLVSELARGVDRNSTGKRRYFSSAQRYA